MLDIKLQFQTGSVNVIAVQITSTKAAEIRDTFATVYGGSNAEEDILGYGHVTSTSGIVAAKRADVIYSPTSLGYIEARFASTSNIVEVNMRVLMRKA
jgi:hypothetical protein